MCKLFRKRVAVTGHRENGEFDAEQDDQHQAEPEGREADAEGGNDADNLVRQPALIARRDRRHRHGDQYRQHNAAKHQRQSGLDARGDQLQHIDLVEDRAPHLAVREVAQEVEILGEHGLIEAVLRADAGDRFGGGAGAEQNASGVAGDQPDKDERDHADAEQHR